VGGCHKERSGTSRDFVGCKVLNRLGWKRTTSSFDDFRLLGAEMSS